ncbi:hypothetical protein [Desulfobacter curvatus]|uniref:hypothetical protein n=1 Tax=Desulfobacter curvatus TaxID=2290 RepID=UPI00037F12A0|nr:hypothetical protein [Desulfobacter curvatus]
MIDNTQDIPLSFDRLREMGIEEIQKLSGKIWTDFNLHDPGVTILEQLCYALTDLAYRVDHDVADILTRENGSIDFENLGLCLPEQIYPCRPVTINDYRKLILDADPGIDAVWIEPETDGTEQYRIRIKPGVFANGDQNFNKKVVETVTRVYHEHRNLCENLSAISVVDTQKVTMSATVDIRADVSPEAVLARIYFEACRQISPWPEFKTFKVLEQAGVPLAQMLEGPLLTHGFLDERDFKDRDRTVMKEELGAVLLSVDGVKQIRDLTFSAPDRSSFSRFDYRHVLGLPESSRDIQVTLRRDKTEFSVSFFEFTYELERLFGTHTQVRTRCKRIASNLPPPQGRYRDIIRYYSIQNHFPNVYGINSFGVPSSESAERKSDARNLKAYLLLFEQVMADFLNTLHHLPDLLSLDTGMDPGAWYKPLREDVIPNGHRLYSDDPGIDEAFGAAVRSQVDFDDMKNRVFDILLALYGESLTQPNVTDEQQRIKNKAGFLKQIPKISRDRGGAADILAPLGGNNISGLEHKARILANLAPGVKLYLVEHILLLPRDRKAKADLPQDLPPDFFSNRVSVVFSNADVDDAQGMAQLKQAFDLNCPAHILCGFYRLGADLMVEFEQRHNAWAKAIIDKDARDRDSLSADLIKFLVSVESSAR